VLDVTTISSSNLLKSTINVRKQTVTQVFLSPSAQLKEHSSYLKFIGRFSWEKLLLQDSPEREVTQIQGRALKWPKVAAIVMSRTAVRHEAKAKNSVREVQYYVYGMRHNII
jgi:hypothetical protein